MKGIETMINPLNHVEMAIVAVLSVGLLLPFIIRMARDPDAGTHEGYYLAGRRLSVFFIASSLAGSWVWAPALLVCSQMAFEKGLAGAAWFIVPNVACFYILIPIARRMKRRHVGYTLAGYFSESVGRSRRVLALFALVTIAFQMCAIVENNIALSLMMRTVTAGTPESVTIALLLMNTATAVLLILIHGFKGSVITDTFQMWVMMGLCVAVSAMILTSAPPGATLAAGLGGKTGEFANPLLALSVALSPGIAMALGLIGGPMGDMMFFQRIMALPSEREVTRALALAGVLFAVVPITLSIPGFIAAAMGPTYAEANPEAIGLVVTASLAPKSATVIFCVIIITGLLTTINSAYSAITAIAGRDLFELTGHRALETPDSPAALRFSKIAMIFLATVGFLISISGVNLLPVFLTDAAIASSMIVPVVYGAFARRIAPRDIIAPLLASFTVALTLGVYGTAKDWGALSAAAAPSAFAVGVVTLLLSLLVRRLRGWRRSDRPGGLTK